MTQTVYLSGKRVKCPVTFADFSYERLSDKITRVFRLWPRVMRRVRSHAFCMRVIRAKLHTDVERVYAARMRYLIALLLFVCLPVVAGVESLWGVEEVGSGVDGQIQIAWIKRLVTGLCAFLGVGALWERFYLQAFAFFSLVAIAHLFPLLMAGIVMLGVPLVIVGGVVWDGVRKL